MLPAELTTACIHRVLSRCTYRTKAAHLCSTHRLDERRRKPPQRSPVTEPEELQQLFTDAHAALSAGSKGQWTLSYEQFQVALERHLANNGGAVEQGEKEKSNAESQVQEVEDEEMAAAAAGVNTTPAPAASTAASAEESKGDGPETRMQRRLHEPRGPTSSALHEDELPVDVSRQSRQLSSSCSPLELTEVRDGPLAPWLRSLLLAPQIVQIRMNAADRAFFYRFIHESDFNNNYGCNFIALTPEEDHAYLLLRSQLQGNSFQQQSGAGADDHTLANVLWRDIQRSIATLSVPLQAMALSIGTHVCDLFPHIFSIAHMLRGGKSQAAAPPALINFPRCYYAGDFTLQSSAMLAGASLPKLQVLSIDATLSLKEHPDPTAAYPSNSALEGAALQQLAEWLSLSVSATPKQQCFVLLECLLIPGGGHFFTHSFLQGVSQLCQKHHAHLIVDEVLTFVRTGCVLRSSTIPLFKPDFIMLGKFIGCSMLLATPQLLAHPDVAYSSLAAVQDEALESFSLIASAQQLQHAAFMLQLVQLHNAAADCAKEGPKLLRALRSHSVKAYGVGRCIWVSDGLERLPIVSTILGRLLLRLDQSAQTISELCKHSKENSARIISLGAAAVAEARFYSCAVCGDGYQNTGQGEYQDCPHCMRRFHNSCLGDQLIADCPCHD